MTPPNPLWPGRGRPPKPKSELQIRIRGSLSPEGMRVLESAVAELERKGEKAAAEIRGLLDASRKRHGVRTGDRATGKPRT